MYWSLWGRGSAIPRYDGTEGELYLHGEDPHNWHNRWSDPSLRARRDELVAELKSLLPTPRDPPLPVLAPT